MFMKICDEWWNYIDLMIWWCRWWMIYWITRTSRSMKWMIQCYESCFNNLRRWLMTVRCWFWVILSMTFLMILTVILLSWRWWCWMTNKWGMMMKWRMSDIHRSKRVFQFYNRHYYCGRYKLNNSNWKLMRWLRWLSRCNIYKMP